MSGPGDVTALEHRPRPVRVRNRTVELLTAVPAWAWLTGLVVASVGLRLMFDLRDPSPWIFQDELLYSELAKSFAATGHFAVRETPGVGGFGFVYPALISPAWALFNRVPTAYSVAKAINAVLMSLSAVPVYLLARRLTGKALALAATVLALALPALIYTSTIMTENAFYPVFLFWVLALVLTLERPTAMRQLAAVCLTFLAYATRNQGAVLAPALVSAIVLFLLLEAWDGEGGSARSLLRGAARYAATWAALGAGVVAYLAYEIGSQGKTFSNAILGAYSVLGDSSYSVREILRWTLYHLGELDLAVGILPFAAFIVVLAMGLRRNPPSSELRIFSVVALSATVWLALEVGAFATTSYSRQIQERNLFYIEPLFLIALVVWASGRLKRSSVADGAAAVVAAVLVAFVPYPTFLTANAVANAFGLLPLMRLEEHGWILPAHLSEAVTLFGLAAGLVFVLLPSRLALLGPALVLVYLVAMNSPVEGLTSRASRDSRLGGVQNTRDWIDREVGTAPRVAAIWSNTEGLNFVTLWDNEFFNRSVGPVFTLKGAPDGLPQEAVSFDAASGVLHDGVGNVIRMPYVLADRSLAIAGTTVARDEGTGMALFRVGGPIRLASRSQGIYPDGWSGPVARYSVYDCRGGTLSLALLGDPAINRHRQKIIARDAVTGRVLARAAARPGRVARITVPLPSGRRVCRVSFAVTPTAVPADTTASGDTRVLGTRFLHPLYRPG